MLFISGFGSISLRSLLNLYFLGCDEVVSTIIYFCLGDAAACFCPVGFCIIRRTYPFNLESVEQECLAANEVIRLKYKDFMLLQ